MDIVGLYNGLILDASFRGVAFTMLDSRDEAGRRALRFLFPDRDDSVFQDLGVLDGTIRITGLVIGDDYVRQAEKLRQAFRSAGPATLVHPWLGQHQVVLGEPLPTMSFTQKELRVARFEACFWPLVPRDAQPADLFGRIADAIDRIRARARALLATVLGPIARTLAAIGYVERFCGQLAATWWGLAYGSPSDPTIAAATSSLIASLSAPGMFATAADGGAVYDAIDAVPAAIVAAAAPSPTSSVGSGPIAAPGVQASPRVACGLLLAAAAAAATGVQGSPGAALAAATQAAATAAALEAVLYIDFTSDQDARDWLARCLAATDSARAAAAALGATAPATAGQLWNALTDARSCLVAILGAEIGALPKIRTLQVPAAVPAWLIAHYLSGDRPAGLLGTLTDLVARNRIRNPAIVPAGTIEVLAPAS